MKELQHVHHDPLLYDAALPLVEVFHPIGLTLELATNSPEVLTAAQESWRHFQKRFDFPRLQMSIGVLDLKSKKRPGPPNVTGKRDLVTQIADEHNFTVSNSTSGFTYGWVTQAVAMDRAYLRYYFIEGPFWMMAVPMYLTSIHAACVRYKGSGVLLCGESGAGKSSLAYACARSRWAFLSDDSSNLIRGLTGRTVIGNPNQIRFRPSATELFPELRDQPMTPRMSGKLSIELVTSTCLEIERIFETQVDFIVFLRRQRNGPARLSPCSRESAMAWCQREICWASHAIRAAQRASLRRLLGANVFELRYSNLDGAIAVLEAMVNSGASHADADTITAGSNVNV